MTAVDAAIGLGIEPERPPTHAWVVAKHTYRIAERGLETTQAEPLAADLDDGARTLAPFGLGAAVWAAKDSADVICLGSACAPDGRLVTRLEARCSVGAMSKRLLVLGRRHIEWTQGGRPALGEPEPFSTMPIVKENAYGGIDTRVPVPRPTSIGELAAMFADHPGAYPRNPFGKGYFVVPTRFDGIELPNIEDPGDPLTADRLVVRDPRRWHLQPLPWTVDWLGLSMFPRYAYLGADARFRAPVEELQEVARGYLPPRFRDLGSDDTAEGQAFRRRVAQEASLGMTIPGLQAGAPVEVAGMHRERPVLRFAVPAAPKIIIDVEGRRDVTDPVLVGVLIRPNAATVSFIHRALSGELPRAFLPGIHRKIPIRAHVDDTTLEYDTPVPVREHSKSRRVDDP